MGIALVDRAKSVLLRRRAKTSGDVDVINTEGQQKSMLSMSTPFIWLSNVAKEKTLKKPASAEEIRRPLPNEKPVAVPPTPTLAPVPATKDTTPPQQQTALENVIGNPSIDILKRRRAELLAVLLGVVKLHDAFLQNYELAGELGVGAFGFVMVARQRSTGRDVAVKLISKTTINRTSLITDGQLGQVPLEIFQLRRLCHPAIIGFLDTYSDNDYYYLVTELHGCLWGPAGIEKRQEYAYRPLQSSPGSDSVVPSSPLLTDKHISSSSISSAASCPTPLSHLTLLNSEPAPSTSNVVSCKNGQMMNRSRCVSLPLYNVWQHTDVPHVRTRKLSDPTSVYFQPSSIRRTYTRDLFDCIEYYRRLPEPCAQRVFRQVASAVEYLHNQNICHGDIKDENILIDRNFNIRLIDFGACRSLSKPGRPEDFSGTIHYAAPEVLQGRAYDPAPAEIWTLGILLYTMVTGTTPFSSLEQAMQGMYRRPRHVSAQCSELIRACLQPCIASRATIQAVVAHPWLNKAFLQ